MRPFGLATLLVLLASPAFGYVRSHTRTGCHPLHWDQSCVVVTLDSAASPMTIATVDAAARAALKSWQDRTRPAGFLQLSVSPTAGAHETTYDGAQVIKVRSKSWCRPADDPDADPICYDSRIQAITTVTYVAAPDDPVSDGKILDADIELNAVDYAFYDADGSDPGGSKPALDLWNTLSHELGHLQGLEHPCKNGPSDGIASCVRDGDGKPLRMCTAIEAGMAKDATLKAIFDTTMYPTAAPEETKKRLPESDDVAGIVAAYPASADPKTCSAPVADLAARPVDLASFTVPSVDLATGAVVTDLATRDGGSLDQDGGGTPLEPLGFGAGGCSASGAGLVGQVLVIGGALAWLALRRRRTT